MNRIIDVEPDYVEVDGKPRRQVASGPRRQKRPRPEPTVLEQMEQFAEIGEFLVDNAAEMAIGFVASKLKGKL